MPELGKDSMRMLLMEPETLLRRTVALTARTLGVGNIQEAGNAALAGKMLKKKPSTARSSPSTPALPTPYAISACWIR